MDLKELLGEELFTQVDAKIQEHNGGVEDKAKQVKLVDLSEGGYVSREKFNTLQTEANSYKTQLGDANTEIKSYKDMDIDGIKKAATDWETKYKDDTQKLQAALENERKTFAAEKLIDQQGIKSPLSRKAILNEFMTQNLEFKDGAFSGADDYFKKVKEQYPDEFVKNEEPPKRTFVRGTGGTPKPQTVTENEAYLKGKYADNPYFGQ